MYATLRKAIHTHGIKKLARFCLPEPKAIAVQKQLSTTPDDFMNSIECFRFYPSVERRSSSFRKLNEPPRSSAASRACSPISLSPRPYWRSMGNSASRKKPEESPIKASYFPCAWDGSIAGLGSETDNRQGQLWKSGNPREAGKLHANVIRGPSHDFPLLYFHN